MRYITKNLKVQRNLDEKGEKTKGLEVETEIPQYESLSEASQAAGGDDKLLAYVNGAVIADSAIPARTAGKAKGNLEKTDEEFIAIVQGLRKNFSLSSVDRGVSAKEKVNFADEAFKITADPNLSDAERAAKLLELAQKARAA